MAFIDGCENDVFVSYAHADNEPLGDLRWVSEFVKFLDTGLKLRLGCGEQLRVFFDNRDLAGDRRLDLLLDEVRSSAVFLAIASPSYAAREWTRKELEAFAGLPGGDDRLFAAEMLPLAMGGEYPDALENRLRHHFWQRADDSDTRFPDRLDPRADPKLYSLKMTNLIGPMCERLLALKKTGLSNSASAAPQAVTDPIGTVLLAQTTDELEYERLQVKSYLEQMQVRVLPEQDYPQGGEDFKDAFHADLRQADVFVQLVGRAIGRRPPDLPEGYIQYQYRAACDGSAPILLWRHPDLDTSVVPDDAQKDLLTGAAVRATGLETFKAEILSILKAAKAPKKSFNPSMVYVNAERTDQDVAAEVQKSLEERKYPVILPLYEGTTEEIREDLEENLRESDTLVLIHGEAPANWMRKSLMRMNKVLAMREEPPRVVAIFKAPPKNKPDVNVSLPYVELVDSSDQLEVDRLIDLLERGGTA